MPFVPSFRERRVFCLKTKHIFITGGARSGKSTFGVSLALKLGKKAAYIATAQPLDNEMKGRIEMHRAERPKGITTIEEPIDLSGALRGAQKDHDCIIVDCLTLWLNNIIGRADTRARITAFLRSLRSLKKRVIIISNEIGMGMVPVNTETREFRDLLGLLNQMAASEAEKVILMVSGIPVVVKGKSVS